MQLKHTIISLILLVTSFTTFSQVNGKYLLFEHANYEFPYQLTEPDKSWKLPKKLIEISGLSYIDKHRVACVQDEKGNIYIINIETGEIETKIDSGNDGDYEDIEKIENDSWILKCQSSDKLSLRFQFPSHD